MLYRPEEVAVRLQSGVCLAIAGVARGRVGKIKGDHQQPISPLLCFDRHRLSIWYFDISILGITLENAKANIDRSMQTTRPLPYWDDGESERKAGFDHTVGALNDGNGGGCSTKAWPHCTRGTNAQFERHNRKQNQINGTALPAR